MYSLNPSENLGDLENALESAESTPHASTFNLVALAGGDQPQSAPVGTLLNRLSAFDGGQLLDRLDGLPRESPNSISPRTASTFYARSKTSSPNQPRNRRSRSPTRSHAENSSGNSDPGSLSPFGPSYRSRSRSDSHPFSHLSRNASRAAARQGQATGSGASHSFNSMNDSVAALNLNEDQGNYTYSQGSGSGSGRNHNRNYSSDYDNDDNPLKPKLKLLTLKVTHACRNALAADDWAELDRIRGECNAKIQLEACMQAGFYTATIVSNTSEKVQFAYELLVEFNEDYAFDL